MVVITKRQKVILICLALTVAPALILGLVFGLKEKEKIIFHSIDEPLAPSRSHLGVYWDGAVTTNGYPCAIIGRNILMKGGSAVEAAIAAMFCDGVVCPQSMGIGGGFLMTIYHRASKKAVVLNARETAPLGATEDMYKGNSTLSQNGGLAVAEPGELMGYWEAYQRYKSGNVSWNDLIEPSIELCKTGVKITSYLAKMIKASESRIRASPSMSELLIDKESGKLLVAGDIMKRPKLAETLKRIAKNGVWELYNGTLGDQLVEDIREFGGIITKEDLQNYRVQWEDTPVTAKFSNFTMYTTPLPGSGPLLAFMLNILEGLIPAKDEKTNYQRMIESFKYAYGKRTELGDPFDPKINITDLLRELSSKENAKKIREKITDTKTFQDPSHYGAIFTQPEDHGTAHISVLAPNGDAVSVTSTVNLLFGAMIKSPSTGIILNDEMDDFSAPNITNYFGIPPSPHNYIAPGKRPLSSMSPAIFVDDSGNVRLVVGAAGGTKITSAVAQAAIYNLWFNKTIKEAVDERRVHHQLFPMEAQYEEGIHQSVVKYLSKIGHKVKEFPIGGSAVTAIAKDGNTIFANSDFRRSGITAGF